MCLQMEIDEESGNYTFLALQNAETKKFVTMSAKKPFPHTVVHTKSSGWKSEHGAAAGHGKTPMPPAHR